LELAESAVAIQREEKLNELGLWYVINAKRGK
jgi:hypothetical protein